MSVSALLMSEKVNKVARYAYKEKAHLASGD